MHPILARLVSLTLTEGGAARAVLVLLTLAAAAIFVARIQYLGASPEQTGLAGAVAAVSVGLVVADFRGWR